MQEIRFSRAAPWHCTSYKSYYIQDRSSGRDVHGNETYEYVSRLTGYSRWDIKMGSNGIVVNDREYLGVVYGNTMYRITRRTREVATRPVDDKQLTRWHMKYVDCLSEAKEIIQNREDLP